MVSIFTSLIIVLGVTVMGCYIIPCMRGRIQRLIETALTKQQNNLLLLDTAKHESQRVLAKFEEELNKKRGEL